ncbi:SDR family NAD(P)-dependent oxidoreductase [Actinoplanes sp. NPDC051494]|uniref:SDR family NAD(P)-dependent oxidoreductase n=1 Tax=Actinoplanes sp. NPDC051494 TaxID=3363907 RepID=UPI00378F752A
MARVLVTGSTDGLGLANARTLAGQGHDVVLHARTRQRAATVAGLGAAVVIGDLSGDAQTRDVAEQVNALGPVDAVIHNAGVYLSSERIATTDGHSRTLAVNVLAPYLLTALIDRPGRLVYVTSGMHLGAGADLGDLDWTARRWHAAQAYAESKLHVTALAAAVARRWPAVLSNAVDPGWVPTRMGGPSAPDDLALGHDTQSWLAVSTDPEAQVTGHYWHHRRHRTPAPAAADPAFQDRLCAALATITGTALF